MLSGTDATLTASGVVEQPIIVTITHGGGGLLQPIRHPIIGRADARLPRITVSARGRVHVVEGAADISFAGLLAAREAIGVVAVAGSAEGTIRPPTVNASGTVKFLHGDEEWALLMLAA